MSILSKAASITAQSSKKRDFKKRRDALQKIYDKRFSLDDDETVINNKIDFCVSSLEDGIKGFDTMTRKRQNISDKRESSAISSDSDISSAMSYISSEISRCQKEMDNCDAEIRRLQAQSEPSNDVILC